LELLGNSSSGGGSSVLISGEPGIGKSTLIESFVKRLDKNNTCLLQGAADSDSRQPFLCISRALEHVLDGPLFQEQEFKTFTRVFAIDDGGELIGQTSAKGDSDSDVFAGMLDAVQSFVRDSFESSEENAGLGRLEYGDMTILIEHGSKANLTAVFKGAEHPNMKEVLKRTVSSIEHGKDVHEEITKLVGSKFLMKRNLEGITLDTERMKIAEQVLNKLTVLAKDKTHIIILEDLQWADESSIFVVNHLMRNIRNERILLTCTFRNKENKNLDSMMEELSNEPGILSIDLKHLDSNSVLKIINSMFPNNEFPDDFSVTLAKRCQGNPFFVTEMLWQMQAENAIGLEADKYKLLSREYIIPDSIEETIQRRIEMLDPEMMIMSEYLSCIGSQFPIDMALFIENIREPKKILNGMVSSGMISMDGDNGHFTHVLFRDIIYQTISKRWKTAYHKSLGEYYESTFSERSDEAVYEIARHFSNTHEHEKALKYCHMAGGMAADAFAPEQAAGFYSDALNAISRIKNQDNQDVSLDILESLGDVHSLIGEYEKAIEDYGQAINIISIDRYKADMHRKMALAHEKMGEYDTSIQEADKGLEYAEAGTLENARLLSAKAWTLMRKGKFEEAYEFLNQCLELAKKHENQDLMGEAYHMMGSIGARKGQYDEALGNFTRAKEIREALNDHRGASVTMNNMGVVHENRGDLDKALENYEKALVTMKKVGDKRAVAMLYNNTGNVHFKRGNLDRAMEYQAQGLKIRSAIGDKLGIEVSYNNIGNINFTRGEMEDAVYHYLEALKICEEIEDNRGMSMTLANVGIVYRQMGNHEKALEFHEKAITISQEIGYKPLLMELNHDMAMDYILAKDSEKAMYWAEKTETMAIEMEVLAFQGKAHMARGIALANKGDYQGALKHMEEANTFLDDAGGSDLAEFRYEYASLLFKTGKKHEAKEMLELALPVFQQMGAVFWVEKIESALKR